MARHSLPRGHQVRYTLPQPVTRHAAEDDALAVVGSAPVRRGIAVVAVVGGALSAAGATVGTAPSRDSADIEQTAIGLAAKHSDGHGDTKKDDDTTSDAKSDKKKAGSGSDASVLDADAVAKSVKKAADEGRRLAAKKKTSDDSDSDSDSGSTSATATGAAAPAPVGPGGTASMPGQLIDPNDWYLTLPTGKQGSPDTIDGSQLATFHNKFFQLNPQRNGIAFSAGADGVTTKNSHYPRSELREMDGNEKASWSNTSGTHTIDVREAFTQLPNTKPEVVGVQIHDDTDDVLQIRLEGKTLKVLYANGKSEAVLDPNYQLGTPFDTKIVAANGKIDVAYNGQQKAELPLSGSGWYWKVGAYVQSNGSHGDGGSSTGAVEVFKADVQHTGGETAARS